MKKEYRKPSIKVKSIETEGPLAATISTGGNTGITIGEGDPPMEASSKGSFFSGSDEEPASSSNIWDK